MAPGNGTQADSAMRPYLRKPFGFLTLFLALIMGILYWSYTLSLRNETRNAGRIELLHVQQGMTVLRDAFEERMSHLHQLGELPVVQYMDRPYMDDRLSEWFRTESRLGAVNLLRISPHGEIVASAGSASGPDPRAFLEDLANARDRGFPPKVYLKPRVDRSFEASPRLMMIRPIFETAANISHPRPTRYFTGLLIEMIDVQNLIASWSLAREEDGREGSSYACILDGEGRFILHTRSAGLVGKPFDFGVTRRPADRRPLWPVSQDGFRIVNVPDRPGVPGQKQLVAFTPLEVDGVRWTIYRHVPYVKVTENLRRLFYVDLLLLLIACTGGVVALFLYATRPFDSAHLPPSTRRGRWAGILTLMILVLILVLWGLIENTWFPSPSPIDSPWHMAYYVRGFSLGVIGALLFYILFAREERAHAGALASLRESREKLLATLNSTSDGILGVSYTPEGEVVSFCNRRFGEIFDLNPDSVIGQKDADVRAQARSSFADPEAFEANVKRLHQAREEIQTMEVEVIRPKKMTIERFSGPIYDEQGMIIGRIWSFRDITQQKELERQFLQAQKMEAIGTLAGGIAHDFNNVLTGILGYADLLAEQRHLPDETRKPLEKIRHAAERAAAMVKHLLTFSRKGVPEFKVADPNRLIRDIYPFCVQTLPREIRIELDLQEDLPMIKADPVQIEQVVLNLCVNSRDAMPEGGVIRIATSDAEIDAAYCRRHPEASPGRFIVLSISDTGHGMDQETLGHIFEPFFTTKGIGSGTGLGLSVVHGIVKNHGGWINVYSQPGQGTRFSIYLPVTEIKQRDEAALQSPSPGGNETLLIVDDEETILDFGREVLERSGYTVLTSPDGESALRILDQRNPPVDLVILDWSMPEMGGETCLRRISADHPECRVLLTSGLPPNEILGDFAGAGAAGFLHKPYRVRDLLDAVRWALDTKSDRAEG